MKLKKIIYTIIIISAFVKVNAQITNDILPNTINSAGGYGIINGQLHDFSIGELVLTETFNGVPGLLLTQGFLQPFFIKSIIQGDLITYNLMTPNGDGKNDTFKVLGLDAYPDNSISIFNRWGGEVYTKKGYLSDWDAKGLSEGTYYYIINFTDVNGVKKYQTGFVTIIR